MRKKYKLRERIDHIVIDKVEKMIYSSRDHRINLSNVDKLLELILSNNQYDEKEQATVKYIRENFQWTEGADIQFRKQIRQWVAQQKKKGF